MNGLMPYTTTVSELQRNYKKVARRARELKEPMVILSNNKPEGIYMDYRVYIDRTSKLGSKEARLGKDDFSEFVGLWSKEEADDFIKATDEMFENVDPEMWK